MHYSQMMFNAYSNEAGSQGIPLGLSAFALPINQSIESNFSFSIFPFLKKKKIQDDYPK